MVIIKQGVKMTNQEPKEGQRRISREWQVVGTDGQELFQFPSTSKGLKEALQQLQECVETHNQNHSDEDIEEPRLELLERHMIYDGWDWECDEMEWYQVTERMPTKALQRILNNNL